MTEIADWQDRYAAGLAALAKIENRRMIGSAGRDPGTGPQNTMSEKRKDLIWEWAQDRDRPFSAYTVAREFQMHHDGARKILMKLRAEGRLERTRESQSKPFVFHVVDGAE